MAAKEYLLKIEQPELVFCHPDSVFGAGFPLDERNKTRINGFRAVFARYIYRDFLRRDGFAQPRPFFQSLWDKKETRLGRNLAGQALQSLRDKFLQEQGSSYAGVVASTAGPGKLPVNPFLNPGPSTSVPLPVPNPFLPPKAAPAPSPVPKLMPEHEMDDWDNYKSSKCPGNCPANSGHSSTSQDSQASTDTHTESQYLHVCEELIEIKGQLAQILGLIRLSPNAPVPPGPLSSYAPVPPGPLSSRSKRRDSI
ncbi:MAG: hypothetical protein GY940_04150 [bacterium]|nr:hypothetical protein [bacterium]